MIIARRQAILIGLAVTLLQTTVRSSDPREESKRTQLRTDEQLQLTEQDTSYLNGPCGDLYRRALQATDSAWAAVQQQHSDLSGYQRVIVRVYSDIVKCDTSHHADGPKSSVVGALLSLGLYEECLRFIESHPSTGSWWTVNSAMVSACLHEELGDTAAAVAALDPAYRRVREGFAADALPWGHDLSYMIALKAEQRYGLAGPKGAIADRLRSRAVLAYSETVDDNTKLIDGYRQALKTKTVKDWDDLILKRKARSR